jgi:putative endonuclease
MSWQVYLLRCADGSFYTGIAKDLQARIAKHNAGQGARYTRGRGPVELAYQEEAADRSEAQRREWQLRRLSAADKRALAEHRPRRDQAGGV